MLDGRAEAHLIALSCSAPPEGREQRWSMRLLAHRMVELGHVEAISSYETIRASANRQLLTACGRADSPSGSESKLLE